MQQKTEKKLQRKKTLREYLHHYTELKRIKSAGNLQYVPSPTIIQCDPISSFKAQTQEIIKLIGGLIQETQILKKVEGKLQYLLSLFEGQLIKVKPSPTSIPMTEEKSPSPKKEPEISQVNLLQIPKVEADLVKSFENSKLTSQTISTYGSKRLKPPPPQGSMDLTLANSTPEEMEIGKSAKCEKLAQPAKMHPILEKSLDFELEDSPTRQEKRKKIYKKISTNMRLSEVPQLPSSIKI